MSERPPVVPTTVPLCGPADTLELIAGGSRATAREPDRREWIFAAIHRTHGAGRIFTLWSSRPGAAVRKSTCA